MARTAEASFHQGITPEQIVDVADALTAESNLYGWSIRDLAKALGVTPSVIYHHVGGKDLLAKLIAERVVASVRAPATGLDWQEWFRELLVSSVYPAAIARPGVAKWVLMHGVPFPSATGIFETGLAKLQEAGAEEPMLAYSALLNTAMLTISMGDERLLHEDDGPRDHAALIEEFRTAFVSHPRVAGLSADFIAEFAAGGERAAQMRERYYRYVVDVTITGVAALTAP